MAYGVKYRFQFVSDIGTLYRVDLSEEGFSGTVKTRPLGKAPVIRMQDSDNIRATSCDLVLECQEDGEFVDLYTTNPLQYKVEVQRVSGNAATSIWRGYVATEIYSEPDIAPPYDVRITATDGIGILKEYEYEAAGPMSIRAHICALLNKAGDGAPMFYYATKLRKFQDTETAFMDKAYIDLDYMAGKTCYDVLKELLVSLRSVLIYRGVYWLIVREVDALVSSDGMLTAVQCIGANPYYTPSSHDVKMGKSVGQMGVADMWPVGYLTRRVSPAKKAVTVRAPWHYCNGFQKVSDDGWSVDGFASYDSTNKLYHIGTRTQSVATARGSVSQSKILFSLNDNIKIRVKVSAHSAYGTDVEIGHYVQLAVRWSQAASGGQDYYWSAEYGWVDDSAALGEKVTVEETNDSHDPNACKVVEFIVPPLPDNNTGLFRVRIDGCLVDVYDIEVVPSSVAGYEDNIIIDNGSRGKAPKIEILGGRLMDINFMGLDFYRGVFYYSTTEGGVTTTTPILQFSDLINIGKDFMTLTALAYAREMAAPRIEITGKLNHVYDSAVGMPVPFIKSHGSWALMKTMSWDMGIEDVDFTAVTLPAVAVSVDSEEITSIPNQ